MRSKCMAYDEDTGDTCNRPAVAVDKKQGFAVCELHNKKGREDVGTTTLKINDKITLSTEHSSSAYGVPVAIIEGGVYVAADIYENLEVGTLVLDAADAAGLTDNPLVKKFYGLTTF